MGTAMTWDVTLREECEWPYVDRSILPDTHVFVCKLHPSRHSYVSAKLRYKPGVNLNLPSSQLRDISIPLLCMNCHDVLLFSVKKKAQHTLVGGYALLRLTFCHNFFLS
jgi:hypothetical protein